MENAQDKVDVSLQKIIDSFDKSKLMTSDQIEEFNQQQDLKAKESLRQERINAMEIPKRLKLGRDRLLDGNHWRKALERLKESIGKGAIIVLRGESGTGKSQMAVELLYHAIDIGLTGRFTTFTEIQLALKETFNTSVSEAAIIKTLTKPAVLAIDEFDWMPDRSADVTDNYWQSIMYHIINQRYYDMKDTILTSNKTLEDFNRTTITPIKSRITETGCMVNTDNWTNFRRINF